MQVSGHHCRGAAAAVARSKLQPEDIAMSAFLTSGVNRVFPLPESGPNGQHGWDAEKQPGRVTHGDRGAETSGAAAGKPSGRDAAGRFTRGNAGGPGNPFARQVANLRKALLEAVSAEDILLVARRLVAGAIEGDVTAARLLFSYVLGKPAPAVDPDTIDVQEWQTIQQRQVQPSELERVLSQTPVEVACDITRAALPELARGMASYVAKGLEAQKTDEEEEAARAEHQAEKRQRRAARRARQKAEKAREATGVDTSGPAESDGSQAGQPASEPADNQTAVPDRAAEADCVAGAEALRRPGGPAGTSQILSTGHPVAAPPSTNGPPEGERSTPCTEGKRS
jgi:hypothetical protein